MSIGDAGLIIGIDAANLLRGGGRTHLIELMRDVNPASNNFSRIIIWGRQSTLELLDEHTWLVKVSSPKLERGFIHRWWWQRFCLPRELQHHGCDLLFVPGGGSFTDIKPMVTMCRNMLPFDWRELLRYGFSIKTLRLLSLRFVQTAAFRKATGVIFLSRYAKDSVLNVVGNCTKSTIIAHGLNSRFKQSPREQRPIDIYSVGSPFRILYVSVIELYKHQWHVVEAIAQLRKKTGWPLVLDLVGPAYPKALLRLQSAIDHFDPLKEWVNYHGVIPFNNLHTIYANADLGVFASSCENMPNILLETMASGLPIACSNRASMPEILGDGGMYFDPEIPDEIANALESLISDPKNRNKLAKLSYLASEKYTWKRCADETFAFISDIYHHHAFK